MKIAFIVSTFPKLSETFILNQIIGLINLGHNVEIFARFRPKQEKIHRDVKEYNLTERTHYIPQIHQNKVIRFFKGLMLVANNIHKDPIAIIRAMNFFKYGKSALSLKMLYPIIPFLGKKFDIVHCHFGPNGIFGIYLKEIGIPGKYITSFHGYDISMFILNNGKDVYNKLFIKGHIFMPISNYFKERLIELGCDEDKIVVHRMGVDIEQFKFVPHVYQNGKPIRLLTVGRLVEKKGLKYAICAFAMVNKRHPQWPIQYDIVGEGVLRRRLEVIIEELGIQNKVNFLGPKIHEEVKELMMQAYIFILPSATAENGDQEGIPVTLMEAMATGIPVISTYHSGIPELVQDGKCGFLVPERDVDALAEKIEYLIEHPGLWPEMGRYGRKFVERHYDIKKLNQRLVKIYEEVLAGPALNKQQIGD